MEKNLCNPALSGRIIVVVLICFYLLPIWLFKYFPTQDGPSHIYNSQILKEYNNPEYNFREFYDLNLSPFPNWITHISLALLMFIFPPLIAEKVFLSIYIAIFPISIFYFLNSVKRGNNFIGFVGFLFVYNYLFLMGFYSFAISVPLFFLVLGYWWRYKEDITVKRIFLLNVLSVIIYFSHLVSHIIIILSISLLSLIYFRKRIKKILLTFCCILPSSILILLYLPSSDLSSGKFPKIGFSRATQLFKEFVFMRVLISYNEAQSKIAYSVAILMLCLMVYTLWKDKISVKTSFFKRFTSRDGFLLVFISIFILYIILPWSVGPGGWINDRLAILSSIIILAWFREVDVKLWKRIFLALVILISLINISYITYYCRVLNTELDEFNSEINVVEKNKVILPFFFDGFGKSKRVGIFVNAANYYCIDNGCINLGNYEILFDYFPVRFKESFKTPLDEKEWVISVHWSPMNIDICGYSSNIDYLLIWGDPDPTTSAAIQKCYSLLESNGKMKIYKPVKPK